MSNLKELAASIVKGDSSAACALIQQALDEGGEPATLLRQGMIPSMDEVGRRFQAKAFFVPELVLAGRAMKMGMEMLRPLLTESELENQRTLVLGTVWGDTHDIGKNLVGMMMEGAGFRVIDLGISMRPERLIEAITQEQADLVGLSCLLTTTMLNMGNTVDALQQANVRDEVKIMVGGAPVTQQFAEEIGADGYAPDAASAVDLARALVGS